MGTYTAEKGFETEFDGDTVKYSLESPGIDVMKQLAKLMGGADKPQLEVGIDMMEGAGSIVPPLVKNFKGCLDAKGNEISIETVCTKMHFMELVQAILVNALGMGGVTKKEEKKLGTGSSSDLTIADEPTPVIPFLDQAG